MRLLQFLLAGAILGIIWLLPQSPQPVDVTVAAQTIQTQMAGTADPDYARAIEPRTFTFPLDHGPHEGFQTEWWYITGALATHQGQRFGIQWTLFRSLLAPAQPALLQQETWASHGAYMLHAALSDIERKEFHHLEEFSRGTAPFAGATGSPTYNMWLGDNNFTRIGDNTWRLTAVLPDASYDLVLRASREPLLNGADGLSQKGADTGNASYYYSWPFLQTTGTVTTRGTTQKVSGQLWLDREWSTSALDPNQQGWDWLALHLKDGRSVMLYRLRDNDGKAGPTSSGTIGHPDGRKIDLKHTDFTMTVLKWWRSPDTTRRWPISWSVTVPSENLNFEAHAVMPKQEHLGQFSYWEGLVDAVNGGETIGQGYLELVGYPPEP